MELIGRPEDYHVSSFSPAPGSWAFRLEKGVTIIHLPTGIKVSHSSGRSQHSNRQKCIDEITEKLRQLTPNPAPTREN